MSEFTNDARKMLELVGGRENIVSFTHCATRMRFVLADDKKADVKGIEALSCVKGSFTQGGQFQVIIGNRVSQFYDEFSAVSNMDGVDKQEVKKAAKGNMNLLQRAVANLAEIFAPIIPAIIVSGLILGFRNIIGDIKSFWRTARRPLRRCIPSGPASTISCGWRAKPSSPSCRWA